MSASSRFHASNPFAAQDEFTEETFHKVTLEGARVSHTMFYGCRFTHCVLNETGFKSCRLVDCTFQDCALNLLGVSGCVFRDTTFQRCSLLGVNWTLADWPQLPTDAPIAFQECTLDYSTFIGLSLHKLKVVKCKAHEVDFSETDLTGADFAGTDLTASHFRHTNLTRANFEGATNYAINLAVCKITKARFAMPEALALLYGLDIVLIE